MNRPSAVQAAVCGTAALLIVLILAACGGADPSPRTVTVAAGSGPGAGTYTVTIPAQTSSSPASPDTSAAAAATGTQATQTSTVDRDGRSPSLVHLQAVLARNAAKLGANVSVAVENLSTQTMLFSRRIAVARPPASLEKLYTAAALLWLLGPDGRLHTDLLGTGHLGPHGIWHGNLYLRGDGDPTFGDGGWNQAFEHGDGPTSAELLAQLRADGIKRVDGLLYADSSRFDGLVGGPATGNQADISDYGGELSALVYDHGMTSGRLGPAESTVHEVALAARASGLRLVAATTAAKTPAGARVLARLASPPLSVMLSLMLVPSDDLFADLFAKQLGYHFYGTGTLNLGALAIRQAIAAHYGLTPTIFDGSGLDKDDRSTPAQLLALLDKMHGTPVGDVVRRDLPVTGVSGTVQGVGTGTAAVGHCEAKTGTLNNVTNLAGYCMTRGGQTLAFVFMVDGPSNWQALAAFTPMVGALARY